MIFCHNYTSICNLIIIFTLHYCCPIYLNPSTTSLYNNSVRDWLTLYSLSYLDQYIDDDIIHDWPVKLPDPPPSINFYPVQINLSKADSKLDVSAQDNGQGGTRDQKYHNQDILLFDFETFGATNWQQVQDSYDSFSFQNAGNIIFEANSIDPEFNWKKRLETKINIKIENINESGYTIFNNLEEYQYPFRQNDDGYHFKTQIVFYNEGVKLKMSVNYELLIKGKLAFPANRTVNAHFLIETIHASNINLKQK